MDANNTPQVKIELELTWEQALDLCGFVGMGVPADHPDKAKANELHRLISPQVIQQDPVGLLARLFRAQG